MFDYKKSAERIKSSEKRELDRDTVIVRTSYIGIAANVMLAALKAVTGILSNSIAVVMDAVNNLSDAASSVITIVGTKLAARAPDRKHPFGHGRIEYMSAMIISMLVLYAGLTSLRESVVKILHPETPDYSITALFIIASAVAVKLVLGKYVKKTGERVNSASLINSGKDALLDSVISLATLIAAGIFMTTGLSLEAWLGAVISGVIIKSGAEMLFDTISKLLGESADKELALKIKAIVLSFPGVQGAYDLVLNNYGPDSYYGSIHIEVPDTFSASELDVLIREITVKVYRECNVILTAVGVYSANTTDEEVIAIRERIRGAVLSYPNVIQMHGFYLDRENSMIRFDLVISFDEKDRRALYEKIISELKEMLPGYELEVALDTDFTES
ncbi:MAG TPA: cation transporter [Lachnospiraceae bacterium]|nr:cation transporter [Lachnospiraceae bacterium]